MNEVRNPPPRTRAVPACPVCGAPGSPAFRSPDRLHGVPGEWRYERCVDCGTVYQSPRVVPEDVPLLYARGYYTREGGGAPPPAIPSGDEPATSWRTRLRDGIRRRVAPHRTGSGDDELTPLARLAARSRWFRERAFGDQVMDEMLPWSTPPGRALDAGCGDGRLLPRLRAVGWRPEGIEPDAEAAALARDATGLPVRIGTIPDDLPDGPFDLVTLVHVVEHLADPVGTLDALRRRLAPGGRVVLVYPNPESLLARAWGDDWFGWEVPRHLALLPLGALRRAARGAGLRVRSARTTARWARGLSTQSRALREGGRELHHGLPVVSPTPADHLLAGIERAAVRLGAPLGEEVVAVLDAGPR